MLAMASNGCDTSVLYELVSTSPRTRDLRGDPTVRLRLSPTALVVVFAGILLGLVVAHIESSSRSVLALFVAATTGAILIDPPVEFLARSMRRWLAIVFTLVGVIAIYAVIAVGVLGDLKHETTRLQREAPRAALKIERSDRFGDVAKKFQLTKRVNEAVGALKQRTDAKPQKAAERVGTYFVGGILMLFMLSWGPRFGTAAFAQIRGEHRRAHLQAVILDALRRGRRYLLLLLLQAFGAGLVAYGVCRAGNVPAAVPLGLLVAFGSVLPYVGIVIGGVPALLLAGGFASGLTVDVLIAVLLGLQFVQIFVVQPWIQRRSLYVGPALTVIVLLVGYDLYSFGGALYGLALAIFALAFVDALEARVEVDP